MWNAMKRFRLYMCTQASSMSLTQATQVTAGTVHIPLLMSNMLFNVAPPVTLVGMHAYVKTRWVPLDMRIPGEAPDFSTWSDDVVDPDANQRG